MKFGIWVPHMIKRLGVQSLAQKKASCLNLHFNLHICDEHHGDHHVRPWGQSGAGGGIDSLTSELPPKPPTSHQKQLASTPTNPTSILLSMCVSSYRLSEWTHMCSCCSWGQVPCHWLSDVRVSSSEPRPRPGPSPQLTLSEVDLLVSTAPASRRRATATGGQQLLFHNQSAAKKLFSFARSLFTSATWLAHILWCQLGIGAVMWFSIFCRCIKS